VSEITAKQSGIATDKQTGLVQAEKLVKKYGERVAVNEVSLSLKAGEIFGLLGPNGAGKSTIIGMLSGYLTPTAGSIKINGLEFRSNTARLKQLLGVVPQELALYEENTCEENLHFFAEVFGLSPAIYKPRIEKLLKAVGLWERRKDQVKKFSGGMKRRLNLIVGLINEPLFVMMDEPTVGVDPQSRQNIYDIIQRLKAEGKVILYTTQYMEEAEQLCDRIAIIDHGQLVAQGTLEELLANAEKQIVVEKPRGLAQLFLQLTGREFRD
jgi:ABC-2 type transport system ATP-binding protein